METPTVAAKTVEVREAQETLPELLVLVAGGTEIVLTDGEKPLARLVRIEEQPEQNEQLKPRIPGLHAYAGVAWMSDDFDDELPDEFWFGTETETETI